MVFYFARSISCKIEVLSLNFKNISKLRFKSIGSICSDEENIYVGADSSFICFDCNLNELSRIKLDFNYMPEKNIDEIMVYNNIAYLIDDLIGPLFVFRADVSDKHDIRLIDDHSFEGVNSNLSFQLINPKLNQWIIKENYGVMGGSGEVLHIFPLSSKKEKNIRERQKISIKTKIASRTVFSWSTYYEEHLKGYRIKSCNPYGC
jgi:hypothetical protein